MKKQFCPYNISLKLKELGFDEPCLGYYPPLKKELTIWYNQEIANEGEFILAPFWQQAIDWFIEKGLYISISKINEVTISALNKSFGQVLAKDLNRSRHSLTMNDVICPNLNHIPANRSKHLLFYKGNSSFDLSFPSYQEAREQAILKAIELINK